MAAWPRRVIDDICAPPDSPASSRCVAQGFRYVLLVGQAPLSAEFGNNQMRNGCIRQPQVSKSRRSWHSRQNFKFSIQSAAFAPFVQCPYSPKDRPEKCLSNKCLCRPAHLAPSRGKQKHEQRNNVFVNFFRCNRLVIHDILLARSMWLYGGSDVADLRAQPPAALARSAFATAMLPSVHNQAVYRPEPVGTSCHPPGAGGHPKTAPVAAGQMLYLPRN